MWLGGNGRVQELMGADDGAAVLPEHLCKWRSECLYV